MTNGSFYIIISFAQVDWGQNILTDALFEYKNLSDEHLVRLAQGGDEHAVKATISRFAYLVRVKASRFSNYAISPEDLSQEGMFGLISAIYNYDIKMNTQKASFKTYADKCISNCMISAVKKYSRKKHIPLNSFVSLDSENLEIVDEHNLEDIVIASDEVYRLMDIIAKRLSPLERSIVTLYLCGKSYGEIASELEISTKSVDNAMQRAHKKLRLW